MERSREIVTRSRAAVERIAGILVEKAIIEGTKSGASSGRRRDDERKSDAGSRLGSWSYVV
jgi:hypothetical protein